MRIKGDLRQMYFLLFSQQDLLGRKFFLEVGALEYMIHKFKIIRKHALLILFKKLGLVLDFYSKTITFKVVLSELIVKNLLLIYDLNYFLRISFLQGLNNFGRKSKNEHDKKLNFNQSPISKN